MCNINGREQIGHRDGDLITHRKIVEARNITTRSPLQIRGKIGQQLGQRVRRISE